MASSDAGTRRADSGQVVVGWLVRLIAVLALFGVLGFDAISIGAGGLAVQDQAAAAARAAAQDWATRADVRTAYQRATESAVEADADNLVSASTFSIDATGRAHVTVERTAPTFLVRRIQPLQRLAMLSADAVSGPGS